MKKSFIAFSVVLNLVLIMGATYPDQKQLKIKQSSLCGYTIIEFGKAVDCHGDTIRLVKRPGMQARAYNSARYN